MTRRKKSLPKKKKKLSSKKPIAAKKKVISSKGKKNSRTANKPVTRRVSDARSKKQKKTKKNVKSAKKAVKRSVRISHMTNSQKRQKEQKKPKKVSKPRKPSKKVLSERARKGWKTRRKSKRIDRTRRVQRIVDKKILPDALHRMTTLELLQSLAKFRADGRPAMYPSILRHMHDAETIYNRLWSFAQRDGEYITMDPNEIASTDEFKYEAQRIAQEYDVQIKEVYTLFFSP